ncbi:MAG: hypothetical protein ABJG68_06260 [Crocinitomicaceae bacterium]
MKKIVMIALGLCVAASVNAQSNEQIQNKNGKDIMPVKGEWAVGVGVSMSAVTGWVGSMFGYTGYNNVSQTYINNPAFGATSSIFGKYMVSDNNAIRMSISNGGTDFTNNFQTYDDRANDPDSVVTDTYRSNSSATYVSAGWEWRRGKSRLRGVYGAEAIMSWTNQHNHYSYGNALSASNPTPTANIGYWNNDYGRITEERFGATFGAGVRGFVGVEYFIAPKICIGTEFGWRAMLSQTGKSKYSYEEYDAFIENEDGSFGAIRTETIETLGSRTLSTSLDNFNTQLYFHFYF